MMKDLLKSFVSTTRGDGFKLNEKWLNVTYRNIRSLKE